MDAAGDRLRAAVLDPLLPALRSRTQLFIAPDGALALLPWEALPRADRRRVIDDFRVTYLTTGRDLLRLAAPRRARPGPAVVVAAPDYDLGPGDAGEAADGPAADGTQTARVSRHLRRAGLCFMPLAGTEEEGRRVAELLDVAPLLGADALEARVKALRSPGVLHVATHGFFLPDRRPGGRGGTASATDADPAARLGRAENPLLRSGLALAGANRWLRGLPLPPDAEDGLLTAEDVTALDLHATELVVLSACDTGMGSARVGEGVFGLRRAFVVAGVRTLVTSLWSVPDEQTRALMQHFYGRLRAGAPRAEALREAQLAIRARHPDPWYWGAFICQGDPGPLPAAVRHPARRKG
jgi:CHAT domain-containing protein